MINFSIKSWVSFVNNLRIKPRKTCSQTSTALSYLFNYLKTWCSKLSIINFLFHPFPKDNPHLLEHKNSFKNLLYTQSTKTIYYDYYI